jgi:NAD-dependent oxidoreductase involved in siderophore biosynthesis
MFEDIRTHYELSQLFYFYPHTRAAQRISHYPRTKRMNREHMHVEVGCV